jgi:YNFM family putative membrane transporter
VASGWVGGRARVAPAQASALYLCLYYIGSSIAGSAGGVFYAHAGWPGTVLFVLALLALALASALSLSRRPPPSQNAALPTPARSSAASA